LTAKKVLYEILEEVGQSCKMLFLSLWRGVSGSFYMNVVLTKLRNKMRKKSQNRTPACPFVIWQCSCPQLSTVVQYLIWKMSKYSADLDPFFFLSEIEKALIW
jgi:hypothetical protein